MYIQAIFSIIVILIFINATLYNLSFDINIENYKFNDYLLIL
jgi:hypothetical protein